MKLQKINNGFNYSYFNKKSKTSLKDSKNISTQNKNILLNNSYDSIKYFNQISFASNKNIAQRTQEPNLKTYIDLMSSKMKLDANIKFFLDGLAKIDTDSKRLNQSISIADIGCCDGALCRTLRQYLPENTQFFGLDLSGDMLKRARQKDDEEKITNTTYAVGNAFNLPYKDDLKDAVMASSIMHEIYSYSSEEYNEEAYSKESILHFLKQAYSCLKPGGVLIIKDPATPQVDEFEKIKIANANKNDGIIPSIENDEELKNADITQLCTYDKLRRFCMDFYPAKGITEFDKNGDCIMPRWLVTEFVRHRKWLATPENWAYEIKENYGTMRPDEMALFAKKAGFNVVKIENISIPNKNNIYAIKENEFEIRDMDDNLLDLEDFPMFLEVVLRKPRLV